MLVRDRSVAREDATGVRAGAGLTINGLVRWLVGQGLAGLEAWAGTPGTVGGALHGNAHFKGVNIGDLVRDVRVLDRQGALRTLPAAAMAFGYDSSRLQTSGEIAVSAVFTVTDRRARGAAGRRARLAGLPQAHPAARRAERRLHLPEPRPGPRPVPDGIPWSAGALVDRAGLKGARQGGAQVSPLHGNFIVRDGASTAREIRALVERCQQGVAERFGVRLRQEIVYLGEFD